MVKNNKNDDEMMDEFETDDDLGFTQDEELEFDEEEVGILVDEEEDEEPIPSVLHKGASRPKTDDDWRQLLGQANKAGVPEYKISDNYRDGALLLHPIFGLGVVVKLVTPRKMEVIFENSKKLMAMNVVPRQH